MMWRKISQEEVISTIENPEKTEPTEKDRLNVFKQMEGRYLKVTYKKFTDHILVITAMDKSG